MFPLMPSQEDEDDEDEDEEPPAEKIKRKSPEQGNRPPSDLARHDVIKVKMLDSCTCPPTLRASMSFGDGGWCRKRESKQAP